MLVIGLTAELPLAEPNAKCGLVTWFDLVVRDSGDRTGAVGSARVAWIRVAEAMNRGVAVRGVLDGAGRELAALHDVLFDPAMNCLRERFHNGAGWDVLFVSRVEVLERWHARNIEEAVIMRMVEHWAETCAIVVIPITSASDAERWGRLGFQVVDGPAADGGYVFLDRAARHPGVRARDSGGDVFEIVAPR